MIEKAPADRLIDHDFQYTETTGRDPGERSESGHIRASRSNEVVPKKTRRRFSAKNKLRILEAADACQRHGEIGALLRREGIYSTQLQTWRQQRGEGRLGALDEKKRGRKPLPNAPLMKKLAEAEKQNQRLQKRLTEAESIISFQKKFLAMFGETPSTDPDEKKS
jgi:transposase